MADLDPLGLFPNSKKAAAVRIGQSRFYSREKAAGGSNASFDGATVHVTLSNGGLTATRNLTVGGEGGTNSLSFKSTGKYYFEETVGATHGDHDAIGIIVSTGFLSDMASGNNAFLISLGFGPGSIFSNGTQGAVLGAFVPGDVGCFAIDLTARLGWARKNGGNWCGSGTANPATGVGGMPIMAGTLAPAVVFNGGGGLIGDNVTGNFGQSAFAQAVPVGFTSGWPL